jgi:hypothetical protein
VFVTTRLYLSDAFGWDTESTAMVAISQLREESTNYRNKCPKSQLIKNASLRWQPNLAKILGYLPVVNVIAGTLAILYAKNEPELRPNHRQMWVVRGVAMILTGPLLFVADLIKFIFDSVVVAKYNRENQRLIQMFTVSHSHSIPPWPGHPVSCLDRAGSRI